MDRSVLPEMDLDSWRGRSCEEVNFWQKWITNEGGKWPEDYKRRTNPDTPVVDPVERFLNRMAIGADRPAKVLDIGAGPLSYVGTKSAKHKIDLTVVDPLADDYNQLLDQKKVTGVPRPVRGYFETAAAQFGNNAFDVIWCCNSLDHSLDPVLGLFNLLSVCRIGGALMLNFHPNEAEGGKYAGLHQWNLDLENGDLVLSQKDRKLNLMPMLRQQNIVSCNQTEGKVGQGNKGRVFITIEKTNECNLSQGMIA